MDERSVGAIIILWKTGVEIRKGDSFSPIGGEGQGLAQHKYAAACERSWPAPTPTLSPVGGVGSPPAKHGGSVGITTTVDVVAKR